MSTKSSRMRSGDTYVVKAGEFKGRQATIVDPKPFPDTDMERRRKITVDVDFGDHQERVYLLPRLLEHPAHVPQANAPVIPISADVTGQPVFIPGDITDVNDPRLDPWRPDPAIVKEYVSRKVPSGQTDTEFLLGFWERRENVLLVGDTQAGKTMMVQVLAVLAGKTTDSGKPLPVFTLSGSSGVTDFDLFGQPTAFSDVNGERLVNLPGVAELAAKAGGILYLDEINMMSERVTSSLHPLLDHRRMFVNRQRAIRIVQDGAEVFMPETVHASGNMWVLGTINPGYKGAGAMNEAFTNRFTWIPWGYDESVEKRLIPSPAVRLLGQALREARATRAIQTPVGTLSLSRLAENVTVHGIDTALWIFTGMFQLQEHARVQAIIEDRSIITLLADEKLARDSETPRPSLPGRTPF
jgi:MoxR-like ATPase